MMTPTKNLIGITISAILLALPSPSHSYTEKNNPLSITPAEAINSVYPWLKTKDQIKTLIKRNRLKGGQLIDEGKSHLVYSKTLSSGLKVNNLYEFNSQDELCKVSSAMEIPDLKGSTGLNLFYQNVEDIKKETGLKAYTNKFFRSSKALEYQNTTPEETNELITNNQLMIGTDFYGKEYFFSTAYMATEEYIKNKYRYILDLNSSTILTTTSMRKGC